MKEVFVYLLIAISCLDFAFISMFLLTAEDINQYLSSF